MATVELPTRRDLPAYSYRIELDGQIYTLSYTYNSRMEKWLISVGDEQGNTIVGPVPIIVSWPLFERFQSEALPPGRIAAYDSSNSDEDPGRFDLGSRVRMIYEEATE